jgi:hypothetical protein
MKTCKICKEEKELKEFYDNLKSKEGKNCYCKECDKKAAKARYEIIKADPVKKAQHNARVNAYYAEMRQTLKDLRD